MRSVKLKGRGRVELTDTPRPTPASGEVLLQVLAAGVCQTDLHIRESENEIVPPDTTLGHEIAGRILSVGEGVTSWKAGDRAIVHPCWTCGRCAACLAGRQNACRQTGGRLFPPKTPGVTTNGGMAEYAIAPVSALVAIGDLDPAMAATLTDAALTPYHAIRTCEECLFPGSLTVVIGLGGLGNMALQILRATTASRIVGIDIAPAALEAARPWADVLFRADDPQISDQVAKLTDGFGADVVLDFVGVDSTLQQATELIGRYGQIRVVGLSGGTLPVLARSANNPLPRGVGIMCPYSGTYGDLAAVVALAQQGAIKPLITQFPLSRAIEAFDALEAGQIQGRAVLIP